MGLRTAEWDTVQGLIIEHLVGSTDPYQVLHSWFPERVAGWTIMQQPSANAQFLVNLARAARMSEAEPFSIQLLTVMARLPAIRVLPARQQVEDFLGRLVREKDEFERYDPYAAQVLPGSGEIFINRSSSRDILRTLVRSPQPSQPQRWLLRVVGDARTGTSYTYSFIQHLAGKEEIRPARVVLDRSSDAADIMRELSPQIGGRGQKASKVADPVKQARHWASWLAREACNPSDGRPWWLVFDQCNQLDAGSNAIDMIAQIVAAIRTEAVQPEKRARVVLIGYDDEFADLDVPRPVRLVDQVERVNDQHVEDFLTRVFRDLDARRDPAVVLEEDRLAEFVTVAVRQVIDDAEASAAAPDEVCFMDALSAAVYDVIEAYAEAPPIKGTLGAEDIHAGSPR